MNLIEKICSVAKAAHKSDYTWADYICVKKGKAYFSNRYYACIVNIESQDMYYDIFEKEETDKAFNTDIMISNLVDWYTNDYNIVDANLQDLLSAYSGNKAYTIFDFHGFTYQKKHFRPVQQMMKFLKIKEAIIYKSHEKTPLHIADKNGNHFFIQPLNIKE